MFTRCGSITIRHRYYNSSKISENKGEDNIFFKFTRIAVKESPVLHKLVIPKEPKKVFVKLI